jgi:hydroxymethylglutaryl-CoA synthase
MHQMAKVGIGDIRFFIPALKIDLEQIIRKRSINDEILHGRLVRALETTGQRFIRFPESFEDPVTMGAESVSQLLKKNPSINIQNVRYLTTATETSLDYSKPTAAYIQGVLQSAGIAVPERLSTFQIQHACAAGTVGILSLAALLLASPDPNETGLVVCTDIARYSSGTSAEITQGSGAVSILLEKNPKLLELDIGIQGYSSKDVDDFFRPLGSITARVQSKHSLRCYNDSLTDAFNDYCKRKSASPQQVLEKTDYIILHTPFKTMPYKPMKRLVNEIMGFDDTRAEKYLVDRGIYVSTDPISNIGNTYTGSLFIALSFLLEREYKRIGDTIVGKKILLASYGSGNTMIILSGTVSKDACSIIKNWDLDSMINSGVTATFEQYDQWCSSDYQCLPSADTVIPGNRFYLANIRGDGYREYKFSGK